MAQAHLASLDMTSVDKEDSSSGEEEEEEGEKKSQSTDSATGGWDGMVFFILQWHLDHVQNPITLLKSLS